VEQVCVERALPPLPLTLILILPSPSACHPEEAESRAQRATPDEEPALSLLKKMSLVPDCNICSPRPSTADRERLREEVGVSVQFDYFSSSPDTKQLPAVPPEMLRIGNSLVATYGFVG
jgi:hypothetical protein